MQIKKLTITPLSKGWASTVMEKPSAENVGRFIKERLSLGSYYDNKSAKVFRKIPKFLKGLVNPDCKVTNERKFTMYS